MVALFVVLTFLFFILIDLIVLKAQKKKHPAFEPSNRHLTERLVFDYSTLSVPGDVYISRGHTWAKKNEYGLIKIGVDEFVVKSLGNFSITKILKPGTNIKKGDVLFEGNSNSHHFKFRAPVDGEIKFINNGIIGKILTDPYGDDWSVIMLAPEYEVNKNQLFTGDELSSWMKKEFKRLREFLGKHTVRPELAGVTMQDGGNVVEGALSMVAEEGVKDFENEFLLV
jgi:glycine cleavage system H protein